MAILKKKKKQSKASSKSKKGTSKTKRGTSKSKRGASKKKNPFLTRAGKISLQPLREELQVLVDQANARAEELIHWNMPSRALLEAQRSLARQTSRATDNELFRSDLKNRRAINREFARVHEFLNDYTSTMQGAKDLQSDFDRFSGHWGNDWEESGMDQDTRGRTFDLYRRVVEAAGGWERAIGLLKGKESLTGYGSENLVNNIYDMIENGYNDKEIISTALEQINAGIEAYEEMAKRQKADYDYGIVFDDETTTARRDFYTWRRRYRKENGF